MNHPAGVAARLESQVPPQCYAMDLSNRCLWRDRERLDMPPKAFDVLDYLRRNPGRLVSQDEILDHVWANRFVQPEIVKTYIRTLRRLLGDDVRQPRFIETRPRSGYRFVGELRDRQEVQAADMPGALVGRMDERAALKAALDRARGGQRGTIVITGEAGRGKSALLDAVAETARREPGVLTAVAYGVPTRGTPEPLCLAIALLQDLVPQIEPTLLASVLAAHAPSWVRYLAPQPGTACDASRPAWWPQQMIREASALLEHLAAHSTILLALDDLQWVDPDTADLIVTLARRRYPARLLVVATYRQTEFMAPCMIREAVDELILQGRARELALPQLGPSELEMLLQDFTPHAPADTGVLAVESGGNPRLLRLLAASCRGSDADEPLRPTWQIDGTPAAMRSVLEAGSIAGPRFCAWAVAKILGTEVDGVEELLSRLAAARQYLRLDGSYLLPDRTRTPIYAFCHPGYRQLLLETQHPTQRSARFRTFGQAIVNFWGEGVKDVANDVSRCFKSAGDWSGAIVYSQLAAQGAVERDRPVEAIRLLTQALDFSSKLPAAERHAAQAPIHQRLRRLGDVRSQGVK